MVNLQKFILIIIFALMLIPNAYIASAAQAVESEAQHEDAMSVMADFAAQQAEEGEAVKISDREKHFWLFIMGAALLVLIIVTAVFGIATGVFGKNLFIPHMVTAGLTVTLALAHAVAATVWFNPF